MVLLTTAQAGRHNVMTMSWHMMVEFTPPLVACIVSAGDYSFTAPARDPGVRDRHPRAGAAEKVVAVGNCSGRTVDKFQTIGLTPRPARKVAAPWWRNVSPTWSAGSPTPTW